ncbi:MAG: hypothetical protein R3D69_16730 [Xanthobacteraceae bacterium]
MASLVEAPDQLRPDTMIAKPVWIDPAYDDPHALVDLVRKSSPFPLSARVHKRDDLGQDQPWFRIFWAHSGELKNEAAKRFFYNDRFVTAAKESFGAQVIIPNALMINLNAPMAGGPPHLDLPFFRGAEKFPFWLLSCMGYSGLFHRWAIPIASTIGWFYDGVGGDFEYWPEGPDQPSKLIQPPLWNVAVVSDNEYMWHRVGPIGEDAEQLPPGAISREARLHAKGAGWEIIDRNQVTHSYSDKQVRLSLLWKAYAFADENAAEEYRSRRNDLTPALAAEVFDADLRKNGKAVRMPADPLNDPDWKRLIQSTYQATFKGSKAA